MLRELSGQSTPSVQRQSNASPQSGVVVELAEAKAKVRRWRQELEEKCEQVAELRDELDALKTQSSKIKQENMDLVQVYWKCNALSAGWEENSRSQTAS